MYTWNLILNNQNINITFQSLSIINLGVKKNPPCLLEDWEKVSRITSDAEVYYTSTSETLVSNFTKSNIYTTPLNNIEEKRLEVLHAGSGRSTEFWKNIKLRQNNIFWLFIHITGGCQAGNWRLWGAVKKRRGFEMQKSFTFQVWKEYILRDEVQYSTVSENLEISWFNF